MRASESGARVPETADNRTAVPEVLGNPDARLRSPIHPGRTQPKPLARRGMQSINAHGIPVCAANHSLMLLGRDLKTEGYLWQCPVFDRRSSDPKLACYPDQHLARYHRSPRGRTLCTPRELSPHIDSECPQPGAVAVGTCVAIRYSNSDG